MTPQLIRDLSERIRAGAYDHVAAESLGIPYEVYRAWLARGRQPRSRGLYRRLYQAILQARAQARLLAEMDMRRRHPRDWLLHSPGRETADLPGWSGTVPPTPPVTPAALLHDPLFPQFLALLDDVLRDFPEARQRLQQALPRFTAADQP